MALIAAVGAQICAILLMQELVHWHPGFIKAMPLFGVSLRIGCPCVHRYYLYQINTVVANLHDGMFVFQVGFTALILPLGMQLIFLDEYADLNPLIPRQYWRLLTKVWGAFLDNGGKVRMTFNAKHVEVIG